MFKKILATGFAVATLTTGAAMAAPVTFFAEDLNPGGSLTAAVAAEQAAFLDQLTGVGIESFEGASLPNIQFTGSAGAIDATLSGGGATINSNPSSGRFATSGSSYVQTSGGGDFTINFSTAIAAFGFYGTDMGDFGNELILRLEREGGGSVDVNVGNNDNSPNGALVFFGLIDSVDAYTGITFLNQPTGTDVFGFDDLIIGDIGQVVTPPTPGPGPTPGPAPIPLPAGLPLLAGALGMLALGRRFKA
jgi:hypothetical protein